MRWRGRADLAGDRPEQALVERVGALEIERIGQRLVVLDERDGGAQRVDLAVELGREAPIRKARAAPAVAKIGIGMVADDHHLVIGLAGPQQALEIGERERAARHRPVAREGAEPRLGGGLVLLQLGEQGLQLGDPGGDRRRLLGRGLEPGELDPAALDVAGQVDRLAEQPAPPRRCRR